MHRHEKYITELRRRIIFCLIILTGVFCLLLPFENLFNELFFKPFIQPSFLNVGPIATSLTAPLFVSIKLLLIVDLLICGPLLLYHFWAFLAPALYLNELALIKRVLGLSTILFYVGIITAYKYVLPNLIKFFIQSTPIYIKLFPDICGLLDFSLQIMLGMGCLFQIPVIISALVRYRMIDIKTLRSWRRYYILFAFIIGMLLTPPDICCQFLVAIPLWVMFELSIFIGHFLPKSDDKLLQQKQSPSFNIAG